MQSVTDCLNFLTDLGLPDASLFEVTAWSTAVLKVTIRVGMNQTEKWHCGYGYKWNSADKV